jgi:alkylhydroperoxidase/carboxymuconolactone decarboxylase family protein YurZ
MTRDEQRERGMEVRRRVLGDQHVDRAVASTSELTELKEVLLQAAVYCGVPAANSAFKVASEVLDG